MTLVRPWLLCSLLTAALCPAAQAQQGVDLTVGLTDFTTWQLFGSATANNATPGNGFSYSDLVLTSPGAGGQAGAGFAPQALALDFNQAFRFNFNFFIPVPAPGGFNLRGDGLTFTLAGSAGVGNAGSGLGYENLDSRSVAFAIDTFHFDGEAVSPSLQILAGGSVSPLATTETGLGDAIRDPNYQWRATVDYTPSGLGDQAGMLSGTIEHLNLGSFSVSAAVNFADLGLAGQAVAYGFTAANGLATDGHFVTSATPVPEPRAALLLANGLLALLWLGRRRARG
jgi:hypothetical protein